jgi:hypothetical protein
MKRLLLSIGILALLPLAMGAAWLLCTLDQRREETEPPEQTRRAV